MSAVKKNVFSAVLKLSKDGELRTQHGNRFHAAGPATTNASFTGAKDNGGVGVVTSEAIRRERVQ